MTSGRDDKNGERMTLPEALRHHAELMLAPEVDPLVRVKLMDAAVLMNDAADALLSHEAPNTAQMHPREGYAEPQAPAVTGNARQALCPEGTEQPVGSAPSSIAAPVAYMRDMGGGPTFTTSPLMTDDQNWKPLYLAPVSATLTPDIRSLLFMVNEELCEVLNQTPHYGNLDQVQKMVEEALGRPDGTAACSCGAQAGQYHKTGCGYEGVFNG